MYKESDQLPRRMLRRQGGFYDEDDCPPNEVSAPDSVPAVDPQPSKSLIRTRSSLTHKPYAQPFCKICFSDEEVDDNKGQLCSPCKCRGSMQYVHVRCLEEWKKEQQCLRRPVQCEQCSHLYLSSPISLSRQVAHWVYVITLTCAVFYAYVVLYGLPMKLFVHVLDLSNDSVVYVAEGTHISIRRAYELVRPMTLKVLYTVDTTHLLLGFILFGLVSATSFPGFGIVCLSLLAFTNFTVRLNSQAQEDYQLEDSLHKIWIHNDVKARP
ncbi:hypothetical protein K450DRAFT_255866 [Umbelopsis ramanniana AG]|uniref:RING-CH-type domain-containing protein n=1 Tax=Umbelopsis ramanniana AG TaxID=1314678 RepID=A0AAD5HBL1_UMBRA|nr:uncharacterized protein K450DRAFT_255866 [Umbelopsis ramanniana AG]KAI8576616.1 hypothetical protein K450DRAFT_255866 [Umbelopsis ramanniana AG]